MYILAETESDGTLKVIASEISNIKEAETRLGWSNKYANREFLLIPVSAKLEVETKNYGNDIDVTTTKY